MACRKKLLVLGAAAIAAYAMADGRLLAETPQSVQAPSGIEQLQGVHPAEYYKRAATLFRQEKKDEAVFVFYLGQLRYRARLLAYPNLDRTGEPALFASLSEGVGRPLNEYAFGNVPRLLGTIDAVLDHDRDNPDTFTPPTSFPDPWRQTREGLLKLRAKIQEEAELIRAERKKNGLPNR